MLKFKWAAIAALLALPAWAQETPPSPIAKASLSVEAGAESFAAVTFTMPEHWHIYWRNPGDSGLATSLTFEQLPEGTSAGDILWPTPERLNIGGIINYGYSNEVTLLVPISGASAVTAGDVRVKANWLVCKDICIPESAVLTASFTSSDAAAGIVRRAQTRMPEPIMGTATYSARDQEVVLTVVTTQPLRDDAQFFPVEDGIIANDGVPTVVRRGQQVTFTMKRGYKEPIGTWNGVIRSGDKGYAIAASKTDVPPAEAADVVLPAILLLALAGGLLLNLMPCVLPILSLKALALAKKGGGEHVKARQQGLSYAAGVVAGFLVIACAMLLLKSAGMAAGWGFQLQQPEVVAGLFFLMLLVGLNLFGWFDLPVLFGDVAARVHEGTRLGSFLTGLLAVALAAPCTTPFMAPAIGATLLMPTVPALLVFAALGVGMALPFLIISFWPAALRLLPKPGPWMVRFKQWIALPVLATGAWLLFVLAQLNGTSGLLIALGGGAIVTFLVHARRVRGNKVFLAAIVLVCAAAIAGQPSVPTAASTETATFRNAEPFSEARLQELRAQNIPVFVDATATWCITCKFNERVALRSEEVQRYFADHHVTFLVADWTRGDETITRYLASFGRNGVPLYVFYPPGKEPVVLPQLLTPSLVVETLAASS